MLAVFKFKTQRQCVSENQYSVGYICGVVICLNEFSINHVTDYSLDFKRILNNFVVPTHILKKLFHYGDFYRHLYTTGTISGQFLWNYKLVLEKSFRAVSVQIQINHFYEFVLAVYFNSERVIICRSVIKVITGIKSNLYFGQTVFNSQYIIQFHRLF